MWFVSIVIGTLSVLIGVLILRRELNQAVRAIPRDMDLAVKRDDLEELNASFFDIANDLEGKYSIHEKQIQKMEELLERMDARQRQLDVAFDKTVVKGAESRGVKRHVKREVPGTISLSQERTHEPGRASVAVENDAGNLVKCAEDAGNPDYKDADRSGANRKQDARLLLSEGYSVAEIAKKLGMGVGELRLMLGMKKD